MKDKKSGFTFKPLHDYDFKSVSEKNVLQILDKDQFEILKENKIYNIGAGTFKML
jgi:hypothetical protein